MTTWLTIFFAMATSFYISWAVISAASWLYDNGHGKTFLPPFLMAVFSIMLFLIMTAYGG